MAQSDPFLIRFNQILTQSQQLLNSSQSDCQPLSQLNFRKTSVYFVKTLVQYVGSFELDPNIYQKLTQISKILDKNFAEFMRMQYNQQYHDSRNSHWYHDTEQENQDFEWQNNAFKNSPGLCLQPPSQLHQQEIESYLKEIELKNNHLRTMLKIDVNSLNYKSQRSLKHIYQYQNDKQVSESEVQTEVSISGSTSKQWIQLIKKMYLEESGEFVESNVLVQVEQADFLVNTKQKNGKSKPKKATAKKLSQKCQNEMKDNQKKNTPNLQILATVNQIFQTKDITNSKSAKKIVRFPKSKQSRIIEGSQVFQGFKGETNEYNENIKENGEIEYIGETKKNQERDRVTQQERVKLQERVKEDERVKLCEKEQQREYQENKEKYQEAKEKRREGQKKRNYQRSQKDSSFSSTKKYKGIGSENLSGDDRQSSKFIETLGTISKKSDNNGCSSRKIGLSSRNQGFSSRNIYYKSKEQYTQTQGELITDQIGSNQCPYIRPNKYHNTNVYQLEQNEKKFQRMKNQQAKTVIRKKLALGKIKSQMADVCYVKQSQPLFKPSLMQMYKGRESFKLIKQGHGDQEDQGLEEYVANIITNASQEQDQTVNQNQVNRNKHSRQISKLGRLTDNSQHLTIKISEEKKESKIAVISQRNSSFNSSLYSKKSQEPKAQKNSSFVKTKRKPSNKHSRNKYKFHILQNRETSSNDQPEGSKANSNQQKGIIQKIQPKNKEIFSKQKKLKRTCLDSSKLADESNEHEKDEALCNRVSRTSEGGNKRERVISTKQESGKHANSVSAPKQKGKTEHYNSKYDKKHVSKLTSSPTLHGFRGIKRQLLSYLEMLEVVHLKYCSQDCSHLSDLKSETMSSDNLLSKGLELVEKSRVKFKQFNHCS